MRDNLWRRFKRKSGMVVDCYRLKEYGNLSLFWVASMCKITFRIKQNIVEMHEDDCNDFVIIVRLRPSRA